MTPARVDVGVVTWNTRDLTVAALRRLLDTQQGADIRLLVLDNASSDGTADAIAARVPEAVLVRNPTNVGFAAGVNALLERSTAPWFLALNSDAWPEPGAIGAMVDAGERHPSAAVVAPRLEHPDGTLDHSTHPFPSARVAALLALGAYRWIDRSRLEALCLDGFWAHDRARPVDWAIGAALLMRRAAIDEVGGFDERFFMYAEDLEWCWRARRRGWDVWFDPSAVVRHVGNASAGQSYGAARTAAHLRNTHRFYRREHGLPAAVAYRALNAVGALRLAAVARWEGNRAQARRWLDEVAVHLRPASGPDGPPVLS